ncbi:hypothetical protein RJ639_046512 [Escallonia herrerae]|uniref:MYB transcription factor n=1 Tax=Escallonia herrerae TaxID=1293975 RepID=A0AA88WCT7_9ASTE|nr:hypothetical protein RJ639_046512 [Escallonia herrerae]
MGRSPQRDENISGLMMKKGPWTPEEDDKLVEYINRHGHGSWRALPKLAGLNRWSAIATRLPGRTDNEIKNFWNTHIRKKLLQMGIDPVTHRPRTDQYLDNIFLANLPQLILAAAGTSNNPLVNDILPRGWDTNNNALTRLQSDAKIQILHNILQVLSTSANTSTPAPSTTMEALNNFLHLGLTAAAPVHNQQQLYEHLIRQLQIDPRDQLFEGLLGNEPPVGMASFPAHLGTTSNFPNLELLPDQYCDDNNNHQPVATSILENYHDFGSSSSCVNFPRANSFPALVDSASPERPHNTDQMAYKVNQVISTDVSNPSSSTSTNFDAAFGKVLMDDDGATESYWRDLIE